MIRALLLTSEAAPSTTAWGHTLVQMLLYAARLLLLFLGIVLLIPGLQYPPIKRNKEPTPAPNLRRRLHDKVWAGLLLPHLAQIKTRYKCHR